MSRLTDKIIREVRLFFLYSSDCADKSSVAEMAEKPLYRVTCGDIGTKPEEVEKVCIRELNRGGNSSLLTQPQYLETVLLLGKIWGCGEFLRFRDESSAYRIHSGPAR